MNGEKMVANKTPEVDGAQKVANEMTAPETTRECPPNCIPRKLTTRDRNYIFAAALSYIKHGKGRKQSDFNKYQLLSSLLRFEESKIFFAVAKDDIDERIYEWNGRRVQYQLWKQVHEGAISLEEAVKRYPSFTYDPKAKPERPPSVAPSYTEEEKVGTTETFFIPKTLDAWATKVLEGDWWTDVDMNETLNEGISAVLLKYGIVKEELEG